MNHSATSENFSSSRPLTGARKVAEVFASARSRWPEVRLTMDAFQAHLERVSWVGGAEATLEALYLCAACSLKDWAACEILERGYFPALRARLRTYSHRSDFIDEVLQFVREKLFVGPPPRIGSYGGMGPFDAWLRTVAERAARDYARALRANERRERSMALATIQWQEAGLPLIGASPWIGAKRLAIEETLERTLAELPSEERELLCAYYFEQRSADVLSQAMALDRATVYRRLRKAEGRARQHLVRRLAMLELAWTREDLATLLHSFREQMDLGVVRRAVVEGR